MKEIFFKGTTEKGIFKFLERKKERKLLNFLNQHDLFHVVRTPLFYSAMGGKNNLNFIDGFFISFCLSVANFKRTPRTRGPTFTRDFLSDKELSANKTHFFIGLGKNELKDLKKKFPHLKKTFCYNPPFIKDIQFSEKEISKMAARINKSKSDFVWVGVGSPKQNILAQDLFPLTKNKYYFNVGAAIDFLLNKKKEAPLWVRELGIESFYRLITDFKYSRKKVWRSFLGAGYVLAGKVKIKIAHRKFYKL